MERHKADINQQKETLRRNKVLMDLWSQKSDHAEALHKQKIPPKWKLTGSYVTRTEASKSVTRPFEIKELREHNDKFVKKLNDQHEEAMQENEEQNAEEIRKIQANNERPGKIAIEKLKAGCKRTRISPSSRPSSGT